MSSGITVQNDNQTQFSTKNPALLVDRTNDYGYRNFELTFVNEPAYPTPPSTSTPFNKTSIYIPMFKIYHGLGYIPAFETVTAGFGLGESGELAMFNEDAILSFTPFGAASTDVRNQLLFRTDIKYLYVMLFRQSESGYTSPTTIGVFTPPPLKGVQLKINTQIFAMGVNDASSVV